MKNALCAFHPNPDIFFPGPGQSALANQAKAICFRCPVREECKQYKIDSGSTEGIWGGESNKRGK